MQVSHDDTTQLLALPQRPPLLLVEDDVHVQQLLTSLLRAEGFPVVTAESAEEALAAMHRHFFQILVTDIHMPGMGGLALCREVRAARLEGYVYIMALTGQRDAEGVVSALQAGADDHVHKGVSPAELAARLQTAVRIVTLEHRLRLMLDEQRRLAGSDTLTGLPNRRAFSKQFNAEFKRAQRFKEDVAVVLLDIDHFKRINDHYGHAVGDEVLKHFAMRVRSALPRIFDLFARVGGEEFALVLPQTGLEGATGTAERLRRAVADEPFAVARRVIPVTVSIGVSALRETAIGTCTPEDIVDLADQRLYASKQRGRNRVTSTSGEVSRPRRLGELYR